MKSNELKIGSTYLSTKFNIPVTLTPEDICQMVYNADGAEIEPDNVVKSIPLTEEWLIKFGFKIKNENFGQYAIFEDIYLWKGTHAKYWGYATVNDRVLECNEVRIGLKYVHQLQNLVFVLIEKELEYEKEK